MKFILSEDLRIIEIKTKMKSMLKEHKIDYEEVQSFFSSI